MSTTNTTVPAITPTTGSLAGTGVVAAALASAATTTVAAAGSAAGISLDTRSSTPLPPRRRSSC